MISLFQYQLLRDNKEEVHPHYPRGRDFVAHAIPSLSGLDSRLRYGHRMY
jgi:hypothetical protein